MICLRYVPLRAEFDGLSAASQGMVLLRCIAQRFRHVISSIVLRDVIGA